MARIKFNPSRAGKLIVDVWENPLLRVRLLENPKRILKRYGVRVQSRHRIIVHEDTEVTVHVVIPRRPGKIDRSDAYLRRLGNGFLDGCGDG